MVSLETSLGSLKLSNPVIPASGTFGFGYEMSELYDINILGSISLKGTTKSPRFGNPTPRIAECPAGMINSVGLQNPGVEQVISTELKRLEKVFSKPAIANVGGFSIDEYVYCCERLGECEQIGAVEVNISCPNVHGGAISFGVSAQSAYEVTRAVKKACKKPVFIKLTPNVTDITEIAVACEHAGADGISMINTLMGMRISLKTRRPVIANETGGYSGPGIFPVALRMVYDTYKKVKIPIMGMGGVSSAAQVMEMMLAGASAVQIGAANLVEPYICRDIIEQLPAEMEKYGVKALSDIIGGSHHG